MFGILSVCVPYELLDTFEEAVTLRGYSIVVREHDDDNASCVISGSGISPEDYREIMSEITLG